MRDAVTPIDPFERLRETTRDAHRRLEDGLDILRLPLSEARFAAILRRFLGFHAAWEPTLARHPALHPLVEGRGRTALLRQDLAALGDDPEAIERLPACEGARHLADTPAAALGSLYVIEGSTLGGRMITRALAAAPWLPAAGLGYFDPYGDRTGAMWRGFKEEARRLVPPQDWPEVEAGADRTFATMLPWLTEGLPAA